MLIESKSVVAKFIELRQVRAAAGGNTARMKYPESLRRAAVSYLRSVGEHKISMIAAELGVGEASLKRWEKCTPRSRQPMGTPPVFLPVDVITSRAVEEVPTERATVGSLTVTCREISVDFGATPDRALLTAVLAAFQFRQGGAPL